ncbi:MAG: phage baseplate assembly protein V [Shewanella sp.]|nr:phage baseplate assembly protein V [Shewanella sp.]
MSAALKELYRRLDEVERKLSQMVVRGKIVEVDTKKVLARVGYGEGLTTAWLPWKPIRAGKAVVWWSPEVGEGVTVISPGELSLGEIYPGSYQTDFPAPSDDPDLMLIAFGDGAEVSYQRKQHQLKALLPDKGTAELRAKGGIKLIGDTRIEGTLHATKDISSDANVSDAVRSMADDRGIYNGHDHPHGDPTVPPTSAIK